MIIAIDFDGTVVEDKYPKIGKLLPNAAKVIRELHRYYTIIIYTCRHIEQDLMEMCGFLDDNDIPYDYVNKNVPEMIEKYGESRKIYADIYIDDHNLMGVPLWEDIFEIIEELEAGK